MMALIRNLLLFSLNISIAAMTSIHNDTNLIKTSPNSSLITPNSSSEQYGNVSVKNIQPDNNTHFKPEMDNNSLTEIDYEDYIYDYEVSLVTVDIAELVSVSMVYGLTLLLGAVGNSLVIICIARYRRMHCVTNIFLVSLATADLLLVCACVPIKFAKWFAYTWTFGEFLCKSVHYVQNLSVICSVLTLTVMSLERYYAILQPMQARSHCTTSRAKKLVIIIWTVSVILATPILKGQILKEVGFRHKGYWCVKEWAHPVYEKIYEVWMLILILIFPLAAMIFAYTSICIELWLVTSKRVRLTARSQCGASSGSPSRITGNGEFGRRKTQTAHADDNSTRKQVIKMLVAIVVLFAICWGPTLIDNVLVAFHYVHKQHQDHLKYMRQAFSLMSYFNSCVNPIVYAFMSRNFRNGFRKALCGPCCKTRDQGSECRMGRGTGQPTRRLGGNRNRLDSFQQACSTRARNGAASCATGESISMVYTQGVGRVNKALARNATGKQIMYSSKSTELFDVASSNFD